jgi:regulator of protease activity HflC (stomatin/prohibitin superfamily)
MFLKYFKGEPNVHVIQFSNGRIVRHGDGINFWFSPINTSIAAVPTVSRETPFVFSEHTNDHQTVALQGALTYRIVDPLIVASRLNFTIDPDSGRYRSEDPDKLSQRVVNAVQSHTRSLISRLSLEEALRQVRSLSAAVFEAIEAEPPLAGLGIEVESLHFTAVQATAEMQKALEADFRESLQQRADQAIYDRRAAAVAEERRIRESELNTEVELENRRKDLVDTQARNNLALAEADAKAEELKLNPYAAMAPQALVALALREWAGNAGTIGNLSITPDLLDRVVGWVSGSAGEARR